jgi:hypothetical protein
LESPLLATVYVKDDDTIPIQVVAIMNKSDDANAKPPQTATSVNEAKPVAIATMNVKDNDSGAVDKSEAGVIRPHADMFENKPEASREVSMKFKRDSDASALQLAARETTLESAGARSDAKMMDTGLPKAAAPEKETATDHVAATMDAEVVVDACTEKKHTRDMEEQVEGTHDEGSQPTNKARLAENIGMHDAGEVSFAKKADAYTALDVATTREVEPIEELNRCDIDKLKMTLFSAGSLVHRGRGFEKLFAQYWSALSLIVVARESDDLPRLRGIVKSFLTTRKLQRLHNKLILGKAAVD